MNGVWSMNKKKIIIIAIYLMSLLIFSFIAEFNTNKFMNWYMETMNYGNILVTLVPSLMAEFLHIIITIIIAITIKASKKVDLKIKKTFYKMPIFTIFLWVPIAVISSNMI